MNKASLKISIILFCSTIFIALNAWAETSYTLRKNTKEARNGTMSIQDTKDGLLITGVIVGNEPQWPTSANQMATSDHIEIWLADADPIHFPTPGWGHQRKEERLYSPQDCDHLAQQSRNVCKDWYKKQVKYRSELIKIFVRQWQIAPNIVEETYATPAFKVLEKYKNVSSPNNSDMTKTLAQKLAPLKPSAKPIIHYFKQKQSGYSFEVLIPWNAFPPLQRLALQRMRVIVDVFSPGKGALQYGAYSSNAPAHLYGDPNSFPIYQFKNARNYFLTSCHYNLRDANPHPYNIYAKDIYYFPGENLKLDKVIVISNEVFGYQYEPDVNSYSPIPFEVSFIKRGKNDE